MQNATFEFSHPLGLYILKETTRRELQVAWQGYRRYPNIVPGPKGLTGSRKQTYTWMVFLNAMQKMWESFVTALYSYCNLDLSFKLQEIEEEIH